MLPQHGRPVQNTVEQGARFGVPSGNRREELRDGLTECLRERPRPEAERASSENVSLESSQAFVELAHNLRGLCRQFFFVSGNTGSHVISRVAFDRPCVRTETAKYIESLG